MCVDRPPHPEPGEPWALDNGAYRDYKAQSPPNADFYRRLRNIEERLRAGELAPPLFAVAPDLPGAAHHSLTWSDAFMRDRPSDDPIRWYLAVGDGCAPSHLAHRALKPPRPYQGLFIAGSDLWKATELPRWVHYARERGLALHYARCSTPAHLTRATRYRFDSADSALPLIHKEARERLLRTWRELHAPP